MSSELKCDSKHCLDQDVVSQPDLLSISRNRDHSHDHDHSHDLDHRVNGGVLGTFNNKRPRDVADHYHQHSHSHEVEFRDVVLSSSACLAYWSFHCLLQHFSSPGEFQSRPPTKRRKYNDRAVRYLTDYFEPL